MQMQHKVGDIVKVSSSGYENDYYASFRDLPLRVTHVATEYMSAGEYFSTGKPEGYHPAFDDTGFALYDLETLDGDRIECSLYDWELESHVNT